MTTDFLVTFEHMHTVTGFKEKPGYCHPEARKFCARHGISWSDVLKNGGVLASILTATNDALALRLVAHAKEKLEVANG